ncbi:hypothetical protein TrRE_jg2033, partial [Triparma retinervis]
MKTNILSRIAVSGGRLFRCTHPSTSTGCSMSFTIFKPTLPDPTSPIPAMFWLSGLTCSDDNFVTKAGSAFEAASRNNIAIVIPDTSPRGAGFYVDATAPKWKEGGYNMYTYVNEELPRLVGEDFNVGVHARSICGHSMGGHGALAIALKNPGAYAAVSAMAPISNPTECGWGRKAFENYLEGGVEEGEGYDATKLVASVGANSGFDDILIDQGTSDTFLSDGQLKPEVFKRAAGLSGQKVTLRMQEGFDHSYFFINTFISSHVDFHAKRLHKAQRAKVQSLEPAVDTSMAGKDIVCSAMVARGPKQPLSLESITVSPPRRGEVRVKVVANALCHTDIYTLDGLDPEGLFPSILGHEAGCSTMSEYTVLAEISCAKIDKAAPLDKVCLFGCGVSTGLGAVWNTCKVEKGSTVAVFGLGAVGLSVIQGARMAGASKIVAVDINPDKFEAAIKEGATDCVDSLNGLPSGKNVQQYIAGTLTEWGVDYSFD